jgi:SAM-dependent methyltransferase
MTQPSLDHTFDTSLIDLSPSQAQTSFSTTESAPSDDYKQSETTTTIAAVPAALSVSTPKFEEASTTGRKMPTRYVPTIEAYDAWAEVYDSDGNVLQAIDDYELGAGGLLGRFIDEVLQSNGGRPLELVDLGCGTGRNTVALLKHQALADVNASITGIDASAGMLSKAAEKLRAAKESLGEQGRARKTFKLVQHDFLDPADATRPPIPLAAVTAPLPSDDFTRSASTPFDGLISTLVLEHFPLTTFFDALASLVKPGGAALLTNMHHDMGMQSQAGFVSQDEHGQTIKVRGTSWVHGMQETVDAAVQAGFEVVGEVEERAAGEEMIQKGVVGERGRKWLGTNVWYGMILRRVC